MTIIIATASDTPRTTIWLTVNQWGATSFTDAPHSESCSVRVPQAAMPQYEALLEDDDVQDVISRCAEALSNLDYIPEGDPSRPTDFDLEDLTDELDEAVTLFWERSALAAREAFAEKEALPWLETQGQQGALPSGILLDTTAGSCMWVADLSGHREILGWFTDLDTFVVAVRHFIIRAQQLQNLFDGAR